MARDKGLEELVENSLGSMRGLTQKPMFGGLAWLLHGNLLCAAGKKGVLLRVGNENEDWVLEIAGVDPMVMRGRRMPGWVRATPEVYANERLRGKLLDAALEFTRSLPKK